MNIEFLFSTGNIITYSLSNCQGHLHNHKTKQNFVKSFIFKQAISEKRKKEIEVYLKYIEKNLKIKYEFTDRNFLKIINEENYTNSYVLVSLFRYIFENSNFISTFLYFNERYNEKKLGFSLFPLYATLNKCCLNNTRGFAHSVVSHFYILSKLKFTNGNFGHYIIGSKNVENFKKNFPYNTMVGVFGDYDKKIELYNYIIDNFDEILNFYTKYVEELYFLPISKDDFITCLLKLDEKSLKEHFLKDKKIENRSNNLFKVSHSCGDLQFYKVLSPTSPASIFCFVSNSKSCDDLKQNSSMEDFYNQYVEFFKLNK